MIAIHQENGAVVAALGSSFNTSSTDLFAQADVSIAVDFVECVLPSLGWALILVSSS
jgi:hypothetical protein